MNKLVRSSRRRMAAPACRLLHPAPHNPCREGRQPFALPVSAVLLQIIAVLLQKTSVLQQDRLVLEREEFSQSVATLFCIRTTLPSSGKSCFDAKLCFSVASQLCRIAGRRRFASKPVLRRVRKGVMHQKSLDLHQKSSALTWDELF